jgi:hypothetical protein
MFPIPLFLFVWRGHAPNVLHLFPAVLRLHRVVIENVLVFPLPGFGRPKDEFSGMREASATEVWRWCWLLPNYVVDYSKAQLLQSKTNGWIDMYCA